MTKKRKQPKKASYAALEAERGQLRLEIDDLTLQVGYYHAKCKRAAKVIGELKKKLEPAQWKTADGTYMMPGDMSDQHLVNTTKMLLRRVVADSHPSAPAILREMKLRGLSLWD